MTKPWVQLASGRAFDLLEPTAEQAVAILPDLIHSICRINRFNGHTKGPVWSVGSHSLLVADLLEEWGATPLICRDGLLHDIGEAIYGDVTSPVMAAMRTLWDKTEPGTADPFTEMRNRIDLVLDEALGITGTLRPLVKRADLVALALERRDLMAECDRNWTLPEFAPQNRKVHWRAYGDEPEKVQKTFTERLQRLDAEIQLTAPEGSP